MMTYRILDSSLWTDLEGRKQGFLHIEVNTGTEVWTKAERLPLADIDTMATKGGVEAVALAMAERGVISHPQEKIAEEQAYVLRLEQVKLETAQEVTKAEALKLETAKLAKP
jgi:hypothetical protein